MTRIVITVFQVIKKNAFLATNFLLIYDERAELKKSNERTTEFRRKCNS